MTWQIYIVIAVLFFTASNAAARGFQGKINPLLSSFIVALTGLFVVGLGLLLVKIFGIKQAAATKEGIIIALIAGLTWGLANVTWLFALGSANLSIALPVLTGGMMVGGVLAGLVVFKESLTLMQIVGIIITLVGSVILTMPK